MRCPDNAWRQESQYQILGCGWLVLFILYASLVVTLPKYSGTGRTGRIGGVLPLLVILASLRITLSRRGTEAVERFCRILFMPSHLKRSATSLLLS